MSPTNLSASIESYLDALMDAGDFTPEEGDKSMVVAEHLALALAGLYSLASSHPDVFKVGSRELGFPAIRRLWRELMHIRSHLPADVLSNDVYRNVTLTRFGKIIKGSSKEAEAYRADEA